MSPFVPAGDQARWRTIYALLTPLKVDDVITYRALGDALGLHPDEDRHSIQMSMRRAARELEEFDKRALDVVPNVGYRVVPAPEHLVLAKRQQRRAGKALQRGHSKVVNVDLNGMEPVVANAMQVMAQAFSIQMDLNRRFNARQDKLEAAVIEISGRSEKSESEVADLRRRLEELERKARD